MKNRFTILILFTVFYGCISKDERKIVFMDLRSIVLFDSIGNSQLAIRQYVEYHPGLDELIIAKSERDYSEMDSVPHFGLDGFYTYKYNKDLKSKLDNLFTGKYEDEYVEKENKFDIDDSAPLFIIIENGDSLKMIYYKNDNLLPDELRGLVETINIITTSSVLTSSERNISESSILKYQENLFRKNPPPKLLPSMEFEPLVIVEE